MQNSNRDTEWQRQLPALHRAVPRLVSGGDLALRLTSKTQGWGIPSSAALLTSCSLQNSSYRGEDWKEGFDGGAGGGNSAFRLTLWCPLGRRLVLNSLCNSPQTAMQHVTYQKCQAMPHSALGKARVS